MRPTPWLLAEPHRLQPPGMESRYGDDYGVFLVTYPKTGATLRCIVSSAASGREEFGDEWAWDHVRVSLANRCPNWPELSFIKSLFFTDDETVMQLHVPAAEHLNLHPNCLHLWRPALLTIPRPPAEMVAVTASLEDNRRHLEQKLREPQ